MSREREKKESRRWGKNKNVKNKKRVINTFNNEKKEKIFFFFKH